MADDQQHRFWSTQPVPDLDEQTPEDVNGPIIAHYADEDIRKEPYTLPKGFMWSVIDLDDAAQLEEVYQLLVEHYVEDDDGMFRFDYSKEFLMWALHPPGWLPQWLIGVRAANKKAKLLAFISAIPADAVVRGTEFKAVEINFLCVHKKLRAKRLAPVLIQEITRRVHLEGIFQALYTAGRHLPRPLASCRYYHRSLNPKKLVDVGFSYLGKNQTMKRLVRLYKVPDEPQIPGFRAMVAEDVPAAAELLRNNLADTHLHQKLSDEEFAHWLLPRDGIVYSYVATNDAGVPTDFVSFYCVPSTILNHPRHNSLNAVYLYYYAATSVDVKTLINDALIMAKKDANADVFNCLDVMNNDEFIKPLKFGPGDGTLQFYVFNWNAPATTPSKIGLVLL